MKTPFAHVIGHDAVCEILNRSLEGGRLSHAYLLIGPDHVGKTTVARRLLRGFLDLNETESLASHPDATLVERRTNKTSDTKKTVITVKQIRALREKLSHSSFRGGRKAVFIEEADKMHTAAANALLKTLEEPSGDTCIILRASDVESVPTTVASRCQQLRFHPVSREIICKALMKREQDEETANRYAAFSLGRPGIAIALAQQGGLSERQESLVDAFLNAVAEGVPARLRLADELNPKGEHDKRHVMHEILDVWEQALRDVLLHRVGCAELESDPARHDTLAEIARTSSANTWKSALHELHRTRTAVNQNANTQLALEHVLLSIS